MNKHLVFVYGTLRRGGVRAMSVRFPNSKFIADAKVSGNLYDLGAYPGLLLNESNSLVIGEVYEVDDEILNKLDDIEASSSYWRKQVEISLGTDRRIGWIYAPNPELCLHRTLITSGDWIEYAKRKTVAGLASQKLKFQVVFSSLVVGGALLLTWLTLGDSSPFDNYFTRHSDVPDVWRTTMVIPLLFSVMISRNPHSPPLVIIMLALIIQWSLFGYFLSIPMAKLWARLQKK